MNAPLGPLGPLAHSPIALSRDVVSLPGSLPVPGLGVLAVNSFVLMAQEPVLVDTGLPALVDATISALGSILDPVDLRWIWLTHCDADHLGALERILELAPNARVVTSFLGMGKLGMRWAIPPERVYLVNAGQSLHVGDRKLLAFSPPSYDAPETMGMFDPRSRVMFSSDCFGALLPEMVDDAGAVDAAALEQGLVTWATIDAPWLAEVPRLSLERALAPLFLFGAEVVASSHLPAARGMLDVLARHLLSAQRAPRFVGPDQRALEAMLSAA